MYFVLWKVRLIQVVRTAFGVSAEQVSALLGYPRLCPQTIILARPLIPTDPVVIMSRGWHPYNVRERQSDYQMRLAWPW